MKAKKFSKKLKLNKKTIVDLNNNGMRSVNGGATRYCPTEVSCPGNSCPGSCIPEDSVCLICTGKCTWNTDYIPNTECCP